MKRGRRFSTLCLMFVVVLFSWQSLQAATRRPNILLVMADDMGWTDLGSFGSEIDTPNLDALAKAGVKFTDFHTSMSCSPTRSMLMSGTDNHLAGLGNMGELLTPEQRGKPGYEGSKWFSQFDNSIENIGHPMSHFAYGMGWSSASAGPLDLFKMTVGEGGIRSPLLIAGPGIKGGMQNDSFAYVWDLMPTVLDIAGIKHPEQFNGNDVEPMMGKSLKNILTDTADSVYSKEAFVGGEMLNGKWMRQGDYKAVSIAAPYGVGTWHLYNIGKDPGETTDLAASKPELLQKLQDQWEIYAGEVGVILTD